MSTFLHRLGGLAHRRPRAFVIAWLLILGSVIGFAATSGGRISSSLTLDGTPSQQVLDQLRAELPAASGGQGTIVFTVPEGERLDQGERATAIADAAKEIAALPVVVDRSPPAAAGGGAPNGTAPNAAGAMDAALPYHPLVAEGAVARPAPAEREHRERGPCPGEPGLAGRGPRRGTGLAGLPRSGGWPVRRTRRR
jgi:RND superfamily putative drug exporter